MVSPFAVLFGFVYLPRVTTIVLESVYSYRQIMRKSLQTNKELTTAGGEIPRVIVLGTVEDLLLLEAL